MKKIFALVLFISILSFSKKTFAQGNLQFNAVKYYELTVTQSGTTVYTDNPQTITVPSGKVWKIESAVSNYYLASTNNSTLATNSNGKILLDGRVLFEGAFNSNLLFYPPILPMWLPAGTYTLSIKSSSLVNGQQVFGIVSAIEFNVVP